jgi:hypothetical protein
MGKPTRVQQAREKKVQCEVLMLPLTAIEHATQGRRCSSNGDHTYGRVMCWVHRKAHESGRFLTFVDSQGAALRALLDPSAVLPSRGR